MLSNNLDCGKIDINTIKGNKFGSNILNSFMHFFSAEVLEKVHHCIRRLGNIYAALEI